MEANILKRIFFDEHNHWERFKDKYGARIRPVVLKEIEKFRGCGDPMPINLRFFTTPKYKKTLFFLNNL
ncbi:transposase zinc-binding domain-containing protein [Bacillus cereus]|nr:transposase zinc-binding domain-containing protein [Bacillus cereus]